MIGFRPRLPRQPRPYADFIAARLLRPLPGGVGRAVAETELPIDGDDWFWADDNAKVLEFLALPRAWRGREAVVAETLGFLRGMCEGPFILRRLAAPRLERLPDQEGRVRFLHSLLYIDADLPRGVVEVGCRFHDGRTARHLTLGGNWISFRHGRRAHTLDVEAAIAATAIAQRDGVVELSHTSELAFDSGGRRQQLGRLTYAYRFRPSSICFEASATLELAPGLVVEDVVLTIGHDALSHRENGVHFRHLAAVRDGVETARGLAEEPAQFRLGLDGAGYWHAAQEEMLGFALAIHSLPAERGRLDSIEAVVLREGDLHWVGGRHSFPGPQRGMLRAAETKAITAGGLYDRSAACAGLLARHARLGDGPHALDLAISYDYGAEIGCFARLFRTLAAGEAPVADARLAAELRELVERYVAVFQGEHLAAHHAGRPALFSRPLAFAICGLADMWVATGEDRYREPLRAMVEALLQFERRRLGAGGEEGAFLMGFASSTAPFVDCQGATILALARAAPLLEDERLPAAIDRALTAFRVETTTIEFGGPRRADLVGVGYRDDEGQPAATNSFWNFAGALALRGFNALAASPHQALRRVHAKHAPRLALFSAMLEAQFARSARVRPEGLEIRTSEHSAEGNSETQPWVALALVADPRDA